MAAVSQANSGDPFIDQIAENRPLYYALSCLPFIGTGLNELKEQSLERQIRQDIDHPQRVIALLQIKNRYKVCAIARHVIWVASLITAIAYQVLSPLIGIFFISLWVALAVRQIRQISANGKLIEELDQGNRISPFSLLVRLS